MVTGKDADEVRVYDELEFSLGVEAKLIQWKYRGIYATTSPVFGIPESVWNNEDTNKEIIFPSSLDKSQRGIVQSVSLRLGLYHSSISIGNDKSSIHVCRDKPDSVIKGLIRKSQFKQSEPNIKKCPKVVKDLPPSIDSGNSDDTFELELRAKLLAWSCPEANCTAPEVTGIPSYTWSNPEKIEFPCTLSAARRAVIHKASMTLDLFHVSKGSKSKRQITVFKTKPEAVATTDINVGAENDKKKSSVREIKKINWLEAKKNMIIVEEFKPVVVPFVISMTDTEKQERLKLVENIGDNSFGLHSDAKIYIMQGAIGLLDTAGTNADSRVVPQLVDTAELLAGALTMLSACSEVAFDAEMHSFRSYYGITCTLQLCGRHRDTQGLLAKPTTPIYVLDCIALWAILPNTLNKIFADPTILKIGFAVAGDVMCLYRDFGLILVNAVCLQIGTELAGNGSNLGLTELLRNLGCPTELVDVVSDGKQNLRSQDWRTRPLTAEMLEYAAGDVLHLIPAYHLKMNMLMKLAEESETVMIHETTSLINLDKGTTDGKNYEVYTADQLRNSKYRLIQATLAHTQRLCIDKSVLSTPKTPQIKATEWAKDKSYKELIRFKQRISKQKQIASNVADSIDVDGQICSQENIQAMDLREDPWTAHNDAVFARLYEWREMKALELDESPIFVSNIDTLLNQAEYLPQTVQAILDNIRGDRSSPWMKSLDDEKSLLLAEELFSMQELAVVQCNEHARQYILERERERERERELKREGERERERERELEPHHKRFQETDKKNDNGTATFFQMFDDVMLAPPHPIHVNVNRGDENNENTSIIDNSCCLVM